MTTRQHSAVTTSTAKWITYADEKVEESFYRSGVKGLVAWLLAARYAYEELETPIISDECWCRIVDIVFDNREEALKHPFGKILVKSFFFVNKNLASFHIEDNEYPLVTKEHARKTIQRLESE